MPEKTTIPASRKLPGFFSAILYAVLGGVIVWAGVVGRQAWVATSEAKSEKTILSSSYGLSGGAHKGLDPHFSTTNGATAAPPAKAGDLLDPPVLNVVHVESDEDTAAKIPWDALSHAIASATGKQVTMHRFEPDRSQMDVIREGNYQILVVHAAETPYLVNNIGFVPFAVAGDEHGPDGHRLNIIVNANSPIKAVPDIRSHVLKCTAPDSITGYRAALAYLAELHDLRAGADFEVTYSGSPSQSIHDIVAGDMAAAAVSNDKLISMTQSGEISPKSYRVLFESEVIPRFVVGFVYNLKPDVASEVQKAVLSFVGTSSGQTSELSRNIRFVPVQYPKDFEIVRAIDDAFEPRAVSLPKSTTRPASQPATTAPVE